MFLAINNYLGFFIIIFGSIIGFFIYMLPTLIAFNKNNPDRMKVLVLNFLLGWTVIGFIILLYKSIKFKRSNII